MVALDPHLSLDWSIVSLAISTQHGRTVNKTAVFDVVAQQGMSMCFGGPRMAGCKIKSAVMDIT